MTSTPPQPPPRRTHTPNPPPSSSTSTPGPESESGWRGKLKSNATIWGKKAIDRGMKISDDVGGRVNDIAEKRFGTEAFWPVTGDFPKEMDKAARILRAFTVDGIVTEEKVQEVDEEAKKKKKKYKVIRKIPPSVIAQAKGLAIFTSMRTGFAPFGGAGGAGVVVGRLPDGSWSAPASISPNNLTAGFLLGVDVYDCVLVIRSQKALDSFATHKVTLGTELAVVGGPYGVGAAVEAGIESAPLFSYVRSRGVYAGVEVVGQVFVERFDENAAMYHWPGIKAGDILNGKVRVPIEAKALHSALRDAETGRAQREKGNTLDLVVPENVDVDGNGAIDLADGEVLKLPPLPSQTDGREHESDPETEVVHSASKPGSHNPSLQDLRGTAQAQAQAPAESGLAIPPPLPARKNRPPLYERHSSASHYSDALSDAPPSSSHLPHVDKDGTKPSGEGEELPSYASQYTDAGEEAYPLQAEKPASVEIPLPHHASGSGLAAAAASAGGEAQMSEAEKREWEEHLAGQQERDQVAEAELARRLQQTLGTAAVNESHDESLR